jgi:hypothetical protein
MAGRRDGLRLALLLLVVLRVGLGLVAVAAIHVGSRAGPLHGNWEELVKTGGEPWSEALSTWQRWDALWYQHIAENGYAAGDGSTAFFPLYPLLSRIVSLPLGGHVVWAELLVSSVSFVVAMWLLFELTKLETGPATTGAANPRPGPFAPLLTAPYLAVLLTAFFPVAFFLLAPYTESLFLALTLGAFWLARTDRPWAAGAVGLLAGLTRAQGIFLALPLAFEFLRTHDAFPWILRRGGRRPGLALIASGLPIAGSAVVTLYERFIVGEQHSSLEILAFWGYQVVAPWEALSASWGNILAGGAHGNLAEIEALNLVSLLGFSALAILAARRLPVAYALYTVPSLALLFMRITFISPLASASRYVLVLFPCFMFLATWLSPRRPLAAGWLLLSALLLVVLMQYWARWGFVG